MTTGERIKFAVLVFKSLKIKFRPREGEGEGEVLYPPDTV